MDNYYFACSYPLEIGSIVKPGNWGRIIAKYNTNGFGSAWILLREEVFERVRRDNYLGKPSRLLSIFLCETKEQLREFLSSTQRHLDLIYRVELVDTTHPVHRACLTHLDFGQQETLGSFEMKAHNYWQGDKIQKPEVVTTSRIKIVGDESI